MAQKKTPKPQRDRETPELREGEQIVDVASFKEKIRSEVARLERLSEAEAPWAAVSDGRASGLYMAASLLSDFIREEEKKAVEDVREH